MNNPNFKENMTTEVKAKLDAWFGEDYETLMVWKESKEHPVYFAVCQTESGADARIHM